MRLTKTFHLKMYDSDLRFIITPDISKEFKRIARSKKDFDTTFEGEAGGLAFSYYFHEYFILLRDDTVMHSYIAHEIYHIVEKMTKDREINDEEAKAYLIGYITKIIYKHLSSKKIKIGMD